MPDTFKTFEEMCAYLETGDKPTEQNFRDILYTITNGGVDPVLTQKYKILASQNAPVATTNTPTMLAGQIWTLDAYNAADAAAIAALELISGVLNAVGSKYRAAADTVQAFNVATTMSYDGAPYIVSTDADDAYNPLENSVGAVSLVYVGAGDFNLRKVGAFPAGKTFCLGSLPYEAISALDLRMTINRLDDDNVRITTSKAVDVFGAWNQTLTNDLMKAASLYIEVGP